MSAIMAMQDGQVQPEQYDMRPWLNLAKIGSIRFLHAATKQTKYLIKRPHPNL
jgi:hypothetical protein